MRRLIPATVVLMALAVPPAWGAGEEGLARAKDAAAALQRGSVQQAIDLYTEALKDLGVPNDRRASLHNDRGVAYQRLDQPRAAIEDFNRAVQLFPEGASAYNNRGIVLLGLGLYREAIKDFDRALLLAPGYAAAYNNRANALVKLGEADAAIRDFSKAIQLNPSSPAPLNGRARLHLAQNRPHAALRDVNRAVGYDARFGPGYRGRAEAKLVLERFEDAAEDLSRAVAFDPSNIELYLLRGQAYLAAGNTASALKDFDRALEIDAKSARSMELRGLANAKANAFEDALNDLGKALELDPRSAAAFAYRAWVYKEMGQPELGQRDMERARRLEPGRAEVLWVRGELLESAGEKEEAIGELRKALALKPLLVDAADALERLGAAEDTEETEVPELAFERWQVFVKAKRYHATHPEYPKLIVPLEMMSEGQPRLLEWEVRKPPHKGIGVLRFAAGKVEGARGAEDVEHAAVLDLPSRSVLAVETFRQGDRLASWTWDESRLMVASVDGYTEEYALPLKREVVPQRRVTSTDSPWKSGKGTPSWAPWAQPESGYWGDRGPRPAKQKPKTLFDLLFKN